MNGSAYDATDGNKRELSDRLDFSCPSIDACQPLAFDSGMIVGDINLMSIHDNGVYATCK
jgi:hypothetical protein